MENPPDLIVDFTSDDQHKKISSEKVNIEPTIQHSNEFTEQLCLLKQRFHEQIQSIDHQQTELIEQLTVDLNEHLNKILQKSVDDIASLRFVHTPVHSVGYRFSFFSDYYIKKNCLLMRRISSIVFNINRVK